MIKTLLMIVSIAVSLTNAHFAAAQNISQSGDLTASSFDELGFDPTGLVGYWQLNGNAHDSSGNHHDGTIVGAATTDRFGVVDGAVEFNGVSDYINIGNVLNMGTSDFTVCVWVKLGDSVYQWQRLYGKKGLAAAAAGYSIYYGGNTRKFMWSTGDGVHANEYWTTHTFLSSDWYHVVMVRNNADIQKGYFYVNGTREPISAVPTILNTDNTGLASIGALPYGTGLRFKGSIDEVKVFNRALSAGEVLAMYDHEKGKFSISQDGTNRALSFVEDSALPVQMRSKKESLTVRGSLIEN